MEFLNALGAWLLAHHIILAIVLFNFYLMGSLLSGVSYMVMLSHFMNYVNKDQHVGETRAANIFKKNIRHFKYVIASSWYGLWCVAIDYRKYKKQFVTVVVNRRQTTKEGYQKGKGKNKGRRR